MEIRSTTILGVRKEGRVVMAGDGQVTMNNIIMKGNASKVRLLYKDRVLAGFAGAAADAFTLFEKFEGRLDEYRGNLRRAAVELAKDWRTDRVLRRLEALLAVMNQEESLLISGNGDVIEPEDGLVSIGSGSGYALAAARVLLRHSDLDAEQVARQAMQAASEICIYTNDRLTVLSLKPDEMEK
jgi:ATP-dependent HslUV protease, peptidase subunit HslV